METKASYIVTGAFTLAVIAGVFGFLYWVQNGAGGGSERSTYRVVFAGSVSGLRPGAAVLFDGMRVGEVTKLALDPHDPRRVIGRFPSVCFIRWFWCEVSRDAESWTLGVLPSSQFC
jgi:phospholipid/cholesterol/gamma-HCH transport system substrate-binding protein